EAALGLFKIPTLYAVLLAVLINVLGIQIPTPVARTVDLAAGGSIPLMLILLGVELSRVELAGNVRAMQISFGLQSPVREGVVIQASMPSIVSSAVLAMEYQLDSKLVTAIIFISTLLSPLTLTPLLVFLGAHA